MDYIAIAWRVNKDGVVTHDIADVSTSGISIDDQEGVVERGEGGKPVCSINLPIGVPVESCTCGPDPVGS
jgi:hypothetical protein